MTGVAADNSARSRRVLKVSPFSPGRLRRGTLARRLDISYVLARDIRPAVQVMIALYIVGTSHLVQLGHGSAAPGASLALEEQIRRECTGRKIRRIAEEMSIDALERYKMPVSVGQQVANELGIEHQNVDLVRSERAALGIDDGPATCQTFQDGGEAFCKSFAVLVDAVRERCWVARLLSRRVWPALFICGSDHSRSVCQIWQELGLRAEII